MKFKMNMKKTLLFIGSVIILVLAAISFVFIPAAMPTAQSNAEVFGKYGHKKIEYKPGTEFSNAVANYAELYRNQGAQLNDQDYFYIFNYAFNSAVQAIAYGTAVERSGYTPSKESVVRAMLPYFSDENGKFSSAFYNQISAAEKENLERELTRGLIWTRYSEDLLGSQNQIAGNTMFGLKNSNEEMKFLEEMGAVKHAFEIAVFNTEDYPDSEVTKFAEENASLFNSYALSAITVEDSSLAKTILTRITNNEITFEDALNEYSEKTYTGSDGVVTNAYEYQIREVINNDADEEAVFALEKDGLSAVVETGTSYTIFRCDGEKTDADFSNSTVFESVRNYVSAFEKGRIEDYFISAANDVVMSAAVSDFSRACAENDAKFIAPAPFPLNYDDVAFFNSIPTDVEELSFASTNENFLKTAFSLKNGEVSEPVVLGKYVMVLKMVGEQKDNVTGEKAETFITQIKDYDQTSSQTNLLSSDKVENNTSKVFFEHYMNK